MIKHPKINIVWLKRDLRTRDHRPFQEAEAAGIPYLPIFLFEPSMMSLPDFDIRHARFQWQSIMDMQQRLAPFGRRVEVFHGDAVEVFQWLINSYPVAHKSKLTRVLLPNTESAVDRPIKIPTE
jgi:deoxyribodipyrimidine photo-lyase